jgi:hypothetical protein
MEIMFDSLQSRELNCGPNNYPRFCVCDTKPGAIHVRSLQPEFD